MGEKREGKANCEKKRERTRRATKQIPFFFSRAVFQASTHGDTGCMQAMHILFAGASVVVKSMLSDRKEEEKTSEDFIIAGTPMGQQEGVRHPLWCLLQLVSMAAAASDDHVKETVLFNDVIFRRTHTHTRSGPYHRHSGGAGAGQTVLRQGRGNGVSGSTHLHPPPSSHSSRRRGRGNE
jgi:hypothetical protein